MGGMRWMRSMGEELAAVVCRPVLPLLFGHLYRTFIDAMASLVERGITPTRMCQSWYFGRQCDVRVVNGESMTNIQSIRRVSRHPREVAWRR